MFLKIYSLLIYLNLKEASLVYAYLTQQKPYLKFLKVSCSVKYINKKSRLETTWR